MKTQDFLKEIEHCSLDDLKLIFETQKDLYTSEEMDTICLRIQALEKEKQEKLDAWIEAHLPKEILCPKCDGPNSFESECCSFCGHVLDKSKYYDPEFYIQQEESEDASADEESKERSYGFQYVISFLIPLVGFILGAILLGKDDIEEKDAGKACIILGIVSMVVDAILIGLLF